MSDEQEKPVCDHCEKPLQETTCFACNGKGYHHQRIVQKIECFACEGKGKVLRCPDAMQHSPLPKLPHANFTKPPGTKGVPSPWNPSDPNPFQPNHPGIPYNQPYHQSEPRKPFNPNNPLNPNGPIRRMMPGESSTDAPPPDKKK